jgi:hypothetical protein
MRIYDVSIPYEWSDFWLFLGLALASLLISAILAKVRLGTFPANPIYWHYWVVAEAKTPPTYSPETPKSYRLYMYFWAGSICLFVAALLVLVAMIYR